MKVQRATQQKSRYLLNPIVDDYNIRDNEFYKRVKHISAIVSKTVEENKKYAWLPVRLDDRIVWLTNYYEIVTYIARPNTFHRRLETEHISVDEYILRKLSR